MPLSAFKVMTILASQYSGKNNGTFACTEAWARKYGITGTDTVRRSLRDLEERGLIVRTRAGMKLRKWPTLYALTWQPLDNFDGQLVHPARAPTHRYLQWEKYAWDKKAQRFIPAEVHPCGGGSVTPVAGVKERDYTPIRTSEKANYTPTSGDTLDSGLGASVHNSDSRAAHAPSPRPVRESRSSSKNGAQKIEKLARLQSHLTDADIAKITGEPIELVQQVRESMR